MELLNERNTIRAVATRWAEQYPKDKLDIRAKLEALDPETASADDVEAIIGNRSWIGPFRCDECGKEAPEVVQLGEDPYYESSTASVCADCLRAAVKLLTQRESEECLR